MAKEIRTSKQSPEKKVFELPDFKALGSLTELTKGPAGGTIDALFGGNGGFTPLTT